ncbi:DUF2198 family protein [Lysinibacillus sp. 54212]|uniref:DUF2198 family protein n=1 Tax=Lysinibacillus sp. 54212 TaxID=3119829 RepID=UPI002FC7558B
MDLVEKLMLALLVPGLLVLLFTRITYNRYVALCLAIAIISVSVYEGYSSPPIIFAADAVSLTMGFAAASWLMKK